MFTNITCESLVAREHAYRKILKVLDIKAITKEFYKLYSTSGTPAIPIEQGFKMLLVQFMEDYSDRQMEAAVRENIPVKWFCGYELTDKTPDHSYFGKLRARLGAQNVAKAFNMVVEMMRENGVVSNVFTFIDSTGVITKTALWEERDKATKDGLEKLNNATVGDYSADSDARFGCKGKSHFWYGYKRHVSIDMKHGMITKVAVTPANIPDGKGLKHVCPSGGMIFGDKAYCGEEAQRTIKAHGCHSGVILKNNMKKKDFKKDKWLTRVRMPYEGIFSLFKKRARYRGLVKVQFQAFMEAFSVNIKRLVTLVDQGLSFECT